MANPSSSDPGAPRPGTATTRDGDDPFALLGLAPSYHVDLAALERAFFERSKAIHPDRVAGASAAERVAVLSRSRALNDAYQLLKKPVPRAEYLLARAGVSIGDNERLDPAFLMEILELREDLAAARAAGDRPAVEQMQRAMLGRRGEALDALPGLFAANDLAAIKQRLIALRYIHRYLEECDVALDEE